ncbi:hypothetical protein ANCDUO_15032 [Ancylostoma duodenale]|uniref:Uncharacterized protein n=1 Tax=Ancylostoma duodenale TaxID=51022 RepID=A0A0C2G1L9_9BILA|nr:hypothetical protein ANCDUO_15032 [Ancylostoma duodenale]
MKDTLQDHHTLAMLVQRVQHAYKVHTAKWERAAAGSPTSLLKNSAGKSSCRKNLDAPSMLSATLLGQAPPVSLALADAHRLCKQQ